MANIVYPQTIRISSIKSNDLLSLSPSNYKKIGISNINVLPIKEFLDVKCPYIRGNEQGTASYVEHSEYSFIRNSNINKVNYTIDQEKAIFLKPSSFSLEKEIKNGDILLSTDANIGDVAIYIEDKFNANRCSISSGLVKLNIRDNINKYFLLALLRDSYFLEQLDALTPKGSTIRHSGDRFLNCLIPYTDEKWVISFISNITKNLSYMERNSLSKLHEIFEIYEDEFKGIAVPEAITNFSEIKNFGRIDSGFYSKEVKYFFEKLKIYGDVSLKELNYRPKRGPNLARRDLGRSIQSSEYHENYYQLIYPSDISDKGYIENVSYLGASGKVWFLNKKDILFSAEGNVGKTFAICDVMVKFTTNFHGMIITPTESNVPLENTVMIATFLAYMKYKGVIDKLSVGGQGGSFAVQYWDILRFPLLDKSLKSKILSLYHNNLDIDIFAFTEDKLNQLGVFEINFYRSRCKTMLNILINDLKHGKVKNKSYYINYFNNI